MRRLCMVVHGPFPVGEPRVAREAAAAIEAGFAVDVVATRRSGEPYQQDVDGVRVYRLPLWHRRGAGAITVAVEYVGFSLLATAFVANLALRSRYDVVQVHNPPDFLIMAAAIPKALGARVIFDVHDLAPDMFAMRFGARRGAAVADRALRMIERVAVRGADTVITVHEPYRRSLVAHGISADKVVVVMNSLDERLLPRQPRRPRSSTFRIFYHGTITPPYGVHLLVEAVAKILPSVENATLEICGEGDAVPALERLIEKLGIEGRVFLSGRYLPHREVLERAAQADVGVIPNLPTRLNHFALSSKLLEYVDIGVPVVAARLPTIAEHFSPREVAFFEPGDVNSLARALVDVADHPGDARTRASAARARYEEYRWEKNARRYARVLAGGGV